MSLYFLLYFLPFLVAITRKPRHWRAIAVFDLVAGWTVIGWIAALLLAIALPRPVPAGQAPGWRSPDGRWWWDGHVWQPMPPDHPGRH